MQPERIDLVAAAEEPPKAGGLSLSVMVSLVLHMAFILWFVNARRDPLPAAKNAPMLRYVELMQQNAQEFVEAPGPAVEKAPLRAPLSDANRKASMPQPTGLTPTKRPGLDDGGLYTPRTSNPSLRQQQQAQAAQQPQQAQAAQPGGLSAPSPSEQRSALSDNTFIYREPTKASAAASAQIDWRSAIREVKGPLGGGGPTSAARAAASAASRNRDRSPSRRRGTTGVPTRSRWSAASA